MKQCEYCGKEYPDDAVVCTVDRNPLADPNRLKEENTTPAAPNLVQAEIAIYPEYRWSARDGWKFLGMILVFGVVWYFVTGALYYSSRSFYSWRWGPVGVLCMAVLYAVIRLLTAAYFGRTETISSFCQAVGLDRKPTNNAWIGIAAGFAIVLFSHTMRTIGWAKSYPIYDITAFRETHDAERYLFLIPLLLSPFWEEMVNRGFLYKAFRGSYSILMSTALLVGYTAYTHWYQYRHFGIAVFTLSAVTIVQCYLREKSGSLWDTILCHLVYNVSGLFVSGVLR